MMRSIFLIFFLVYFTSCKVKEKDIVGQFKLKHFPKSTLTINSDATFEFIQNYINPYLLPFEHSDENYFRTIGRWNLNGNILTLNSTKDSLIYPLYKIETSHTLENNKTTLQSDPVFNILNKDLNQSLPFLTNFECLR